MTVRVVVPFDGRGEERLSAAAWVLPRLQALHPSWPLFVAGDGGEPWTKARAVNRAVRESTAVDSHVYDGSYILVIHDADVVADSAALTRAVDAVASGEASWAVPHGTVYRLGPASTAEVLDLPVETEPTDWREDRCVRTPYLGLPGGGIVVVSGEAWATVGGFDERFVGWSGEDVALGWALATLCGPPARLAAPLWHLWHPPARRGRRELYANQRLEAWYRAANGKPDRMRALLAEAMQAG